MMYSKVVCMIKSKEDQSLELMGSRDYLM